MNATVIFALIQIALKYGPTALATFQANEPQFQQFLADIKPALASPNFVTIIPILTKWGPWLTQFVQTQGTAIQQFIKDVEAAMAAANAPVHPVTPVITPPSVALPGTFTS